MDKSIHVPADVPHSLLHEFLHNYNKVTKGTGNLVLFAGDQRVEHSSLSSCKGPGISRGDVDPQHFFSIAKHAPIGCFATQLGLIAHYGKTAPRTHYVVKINSKTDLMDSSLSDPLSHRWYDVDHIVRFKEASGLSIVGIGYTVYLGSTYEYYMLSEAARLVFDAHQNGLLAILWMYPKGRSVKNETDPLLVAGASATGNALGADFVKIKLPKENGHSSLEGLKTVVEASGKTRVLVSGGPSQNPEEYLSLIKNIMKAGASGCALGRNIHQKNIEDAVQFARAVYDIVYEGTSFNKAQKEIHT